MKRKDDGSKMAEIARKASGISKKEVTDRKAANKAKDKGPERIPQGNAKKWLERIRRSEKIRRPFQDDSERFMRMYQGDYSLKPSKRRNVDSVSVNLVYAYVETSSPAIFSGFPYIRVRPKPKVNESTDAMEARTRSMELVINYWFKELAVDDELHDVLFDTFFGLAAMELGWETEIEEMDPEITTEDGAHEEGTPIRTLKDRPFVMRRDRKSVFLDPDARRRREVRWMAIEETLAWNDFVASSLYTDKAKAKLKPMSYPKDEEEKNWLGRDDDSSDREWIQIFTIWDKDTRKKLVVAKGYDGWVNTDDPEGEDWPYDIDYKSDPYPICIHDAKRDHTTPYSWSEIKAVEPQIQEVNRLRAAIQIHVKRTLPKYIYTGETTHTISKLMNARSDEATKVDSLNSIQPLPLAEIPQEIWRFAEMARDDYTNTSGQQEFQQEALAKTATEANIVRGSSDVRKSMRSKRWEQFVVEIAAKLAQLCQQNMDEALVIQIAGQQGSDWVSQGRNTDTQPGGEPVTVTKDQIQGEFWYDIEPGSMEYRNEDLRKQQLLKFYEMTAGDPTINRRNLNMKMAKELELEPTDVIIPPDQMPKPPPPPPMLRMRELDPLAIADSTLMNTVVMQYLIQNGVQLTPDLIQKLSAPAQSHPGGQAGPGGAPPLPQPGGKDLTGGGLNPNGNQALPPVSGNLNAGGSGKL